MSALGASMIDPLSFKGTFPKVRCPGCKLLMVVLGTEAISNTQVKVTYRCSGCGMETERIIKFNVGPT
jgi:hypothetical protein